MTHENKPSQPPAPEPERAPRPPYEPPRVTKKRSVSRATLFTGAGASVQGVVTEGGPPP